ncbi:YgaP family membrane protein [Corynebacterium kalinowskii]|nr:DUF2892 domain-containing protein [Corynebacterium kalinowskii]
MKPNEGSLDRGLRAVLAIIAAACAAFVTSGTTSIILWVVAAILALTAAVGFCPLYRIFGISTCKVKN